MSGVSGLRRSLGLAAATAIAAVGLGSGAATTLNGRQESSLRERRRVVAGNSRVVYYSAGRAGYGWTNAHQKRVAKKARNVRRNRAAHHG